MWKVQDRVLHPIRLLAFHPSDPVLTIPDVTEYAAQLREPGTALFDVRSKPRYGMPPPPDVIANQPDIELCNRSLRLVGTFELGADFLTDGNLILTDTNFAKFFPGRVPGGDPLSQVDLGVIRIAEGAKLDEVRRAIAAELPDDIRVYTKQEFIDREIEFWGSSTPIGTIFSLGMVIGFLVGVVVCYQVISSDIGDHIPEFATLKAMGYRNRYFIGFVLQEALFLSILSFIPGLLISLGLYAILARATALLMFLNFERAFVVFILTAGMCLASGCMAMRKVLAADPADLF
jgi:putative ABC transport system permease protein